jgi:hypothetical protein
MYDVYYNKQAPRNMTESPQSDLGFSGTPQTNSEITTKQAIGIGVAAARLIPAGKQVINTVIKATGNRRVKRAADGITKAGIIAAELKTVGPVGTLAIEGINVLVNYAVGYVEDITEQTNQEYERQKQGVSINKFVGVGERID